MPKLRVWHIPAAMFVVVALCMTWLALRRARELSYEAYCGANLRQYGIACQLYMSDDRCTWPTRGGTSKLLSGATRLPVAGYDTVTTIGQSPVDYLLPERAVGGWAYVMRDYLRNDFDVVVCPGGWYRREDALMPWGGGSWNALQSDKWGYLWLTHRAVPTAIVDSWRSVDRESDIAFVGCGSEDPGRLLAADNIVWTRVGSTCRLAGNHIRNRASNRPPSEWPAFNPRALGQSPLPDRPRCSNAVRVDMSVVRREFAELEPRRYVIDETPSVHMW